MVLYHDFSLYFPQIIRLELHYGVFLQQIFPPESFEIVIRWIAVICKSTSLSLLQQAGLGHIILVYCCREDKLVMVQSNDCGYDSQFFLLSIHETFSIFFCIFTLIYLHVDSQFSRNSFGDRVSLYSIGWPKTCYVHQAGLKLWVIVLPLLPWCWDYRYEPPFTDMLGILLGS